MNQSITVIGAGLAGCEASWQIANHGIDVKLFEMRPQKMTPAHKTGLFGELVCSNSLRGAGLENAVGLLKEELRLCNSLIMHCADLHKIPAGGALAVDREKYAECLTETIKKHPKITVCNEEVDTIDKENITIIASGPLTQGNLAQEIKKITGEESLYFFDAAAPIVTAESIDFEKAFWASRYNKGDADYLNCPMSKEEYEIFYHELVNAEKHPLKEFEKEIFFEGCMPIEAMGKRGMQTLLFGPLKPVGLINPHTEKQPYAVVQLRKENKEGTLLNLVGFQTNLKWGEQQRVFSLIPGLENAEFVRLGVMHRNTFINSPKLLEATGQLKANPNLFFAGQITGVEGYVESTASGLVSGINAALLAKKEKNLIFPNNTAIGALMHYISSSETSFFQPMNINFGLLPSLDKKIRNKKERNNNISQRALTSLKKFIEKSDIVVQTQSING